ncbi:TPA: hypothetical protein N0F65_000151 [Lagenidium giganteum]|uniref:PX domain-containing protein n=1 Tax=Lagenidium giganteum TaxID=4803 RepID=A0AAV2YHR2_9STRA|nr:TPA: hypothetical protein N0F65_000151 [Lagenidium giganteum]
MTPEEIQGDYRCSIAIEDYRVNKKAEYKVVVRLSFYSSRAHSIGSTSWHIWRPFGAFRKLDEQLRKRNSAHMKGIKFPPLYRRRFIFRTHLNAEFLETRMRELDTYMSMVVRSPQLVAFHIMSIQSQSLKAFIGFTNGFGSNPHYEAQNSALRPSISILASPAVAMSATASVMADDDDDYKSVSSMSSMSSMNSVSSTISSSADYRWSGTGFVGTSSFVRHTVPAAGPAAGNSFANPGMRSSFYPVSSNSITESRRGSVSLSRNSMPTRNSMAAMTPSDVITPELDIQRAKMEEELLKMDLAGVGMPPDGSCFLHCVVYEMYPLLCLRDYPSSMMVVNVGAADGMAPRRVAAAQHLRVKLMQYALDHVDKLASFLMQEAEDLKERYETFRDTPDEQATIAELYAASSMFNIELQLITNDENFKIDPVMPVAGLPSVREGPFKTITLGYMVPGDGLAGHYICTRERRNQPGVPVNSFAGGSYRGSINIGPPKNVRCSTAGRRFERIPEQRVE